MRKVTHEVISIGAKQGIGASIYSLAATVGLFIAKTEHESIKSIQICLPLTNL